MPCSYEHFSSRLTTLPDNGWSVSYKLQLIDSATNSSILPNVTTIQVKQILFSVKKVDQGHNPFIQQMKKSESGQ